MIGLDQGSSCGNSMVEEQIQVRVGLNECTKAFKELAINASLEPRLDKLGEEKKDQGELESKARSQVSNSNYQRVSNSENV